MLSTPTSAPALLPDLPEQGPGPARPTVLVVDDDLLWLDTARELLGRFYDVVTAADGVEGLEALKKHHPDVVVTDLSMPRTGGMGLLERARCLEEASLVPFLVLSASSDTETKMHAFQAGASDYLTKPASPGELVMRIRKALDNGAGAPARTRRRASQCGFGKQRGVEDEIGIGGHAASVGEGFEQQRHRAVRR